MKRMSALVVMALAVVLATAACSRIEPFVYHPNEFNRSVKDFGKPPTDIREVGICYNKAGTKPDVLAAMARDECGRFGKTARYVGQDRATCPLFMPVRIVFACDAR